MTSPVATQASIKAILKSLFQSRQKPRNKLRKRKRPSLRRRTDENSPPALQALPPAPSSRACVAIQQEDDAFGAVVISTLTSYPFQCHEDLMRMSRSQLMDVVRFLNSKLPVAKRLYVRENASEWEVRLAIEVLVGIRDPGWIAPSEVPPPPVYSKQQHGRSARFRRRRRLGMPLDRVEEVDECCEEGKCFIIN
ncbi:hypothetical protein CC2G_003402 [Coprinopsis cinerea AmutBmut pab1-1]|nr:hypothetical protein CC2G_003402 [Coprinopsis cinerea AmutBmut pab1-1]